MLYTATILAGILMLILAFIAAESEMHYRQSYYTTLLHARFVSLDTHMGVDLSCIYYTVGRRKRRCDLSLDFLHDGTISRVHAILWHDGENFCIKPSYTFCLFGGSHYPQISVNGNLVPPSGRALHYGDVIQMGHSKFTLENTSKEEC